MTNLLLYAYYYRYRQARKSVKDLVLVDNFNTAKTLLDNYKQQHDNYIQSGNISLENESFTAIDNLSIHHASDHLEVAENNPIQKQATIDALDEQ